MKKKYLKQIVMFMCAGMLFMSPFTVRAETVTETSTETRENEDGSVTTTTTETTIDRSESYTESEPQVTESSDCEGCDEVKVEYEPHEDAEPKIEYVECNPKDPETPPEPEQPAETPETPAEPEQPAETPEAPAEPERPTQTPVVNKSEEQNLETPAAPVEESVTETETLPQTGGLDLRMWIFLLAGAGVILGPVIYFIGNYQSKKH